MDTRVGAEPGSVALGVGQRGCGRPDSWVRPGHHCGDHPGVHGTITTTIEGAYASRSRSGSTDVTIVNVKLRVLFMPTLIYLQHPEQLRARVSQGKAWLSAPLASLLSAKGLAELGQDPAQQLDALDRLRNPKVDGRERIDGVDTTDFRGTLDLGHAFDQFAPSLRAKLAPPDVSTTPGATDVWIGADRLPRRLVTTSTVTISGVTAEVRSTTNYRDYAQPVAISIPAATAVYGATGFPGL